MSSTFAFAETDTFATASAEKVGAGYVYTRWANPTIDAFEAAVAALEGTDDAEAFSSGMAAITSVFLTYCSSGDRIVSTRQLYGGTHSVLGDLLPRFGIASQTFEVGDHDGIARAVPGARLLHCETIGNPIARVADLPRLAEIAHDAGIPLVVDSTFASPVVCRPREHGADIVIHSATKSIGGHHDLIGGVVCADAGAIARIQELTRKLGPTMSPFTAWLALRGLQTIEIRVRRSSDTALEIARFLEGHPAVERVHYAGLGSSPDHELAGALFDGISGSTLALEVRGGREPAARFQQGLQLVTRAASLGGTHSLIVHAASVTHTQLSDAELTEAGIAPGLCRLSVGLEDAGDLIRDLRRALDALG